MTLHRKIGGAARVQGTLRASVIIPVYDDPQGLRTCLACLARQDAPAFAFEVIVVDNGSERPVSAICAEHRHVRLIHTAKPGSYAARNAGIAAARGDILLFTDSDCRPAPDWVSAALVSMNGATYPGVVGGEIAVVMANAEPKTVTEWHQCVRGFVQSHNIEAFNYAATANLAAHRQVFDKVGLFDERLLSGGDMEWGQRASAAGVPLRYVPSLEIHHPTRVRLSALLAKYARTAGGRWAMARNRGEPTWRALLSLLKGPALYYGLYKSHPLVRSRRDRLTLLGMEVLIGAVRALECLRLSLGGTPRRR